MRILIVGMADSVHLAKWLSQFEASQHTFEIVSSSPHRRIHPTLRKLLEKRQNFRMGWMSRKLSLLLWLADRFFSDTLRGLLIANAANKFKPQLVHVLEFQNAGYSYLRARSFSPRLRSTRLMLTPYGSDIFWFQQFPRHLERLKQLLGLADFFSSESKRDEDLARKHGFAGTICPRLPASGVMKMQPLDLDKTRNTIAVKGYQNHWGQAITALQAISEIENELKGFEIEVFSCNLSTIRFAKKLQRKTQLRLTCHKKGSLTNDEVNRIMARSIALVALSKSDGVPASLLEAMANGAIPIQSRTSCADEWLDSSGGFLVDFDGKEQVKIALRKVLNDKSFRESAMKINHRRLLETVSTDRALKLAIQTYEMTNQSQSS